MRTFLRKLHGARLRKEITKSGVNEGTFFPARGFGTLYM